MDGSNAVLADLTSDPSWTISTDGGSTFVAAKTPSMSIWATCACNLELVGAGAKWISDPTTNGIESSDAWTIGNTVFANRTFSLTGFDLSAVSLSGSWRVADRRLGIYINGNLIDSATADNEIAFLEDQTFALAGGSGFFVAGVNTLQLRGSSVNAHFDGFWLDATITDNLSGVPEPSSFLLLGTGFACVALRRYRRGFLPRS